MSIMESLGKKKPRPRSSFTPEFKIDIVELCRRGDRSVGQIAKDFDLTEPTTSAAPAPPVSARSATPS
jgi:transposase